MVTAEYPPMEGGVGDYTARLAGALVAPEPGPVDGRAQASGQPGHGETDATAVTILTGRRGAGGPAPVLPLVRRWDWRCLPTISRTTRRLRPAVVHIQYQTGAYGLHPAINCLPLWLRATSPARDRPAVVTTFHDLRPPYLFPKAGPVRHLAAPLLAAASDAYVVTTPEVLATRAGRWVRRLAGRTGAAAHLIPIGSNVDPTPPPGYDRAAERARLGAGPAPFLIGHFGLVNRSKGLDDLLRALAWLAAHGVDARLAIIGGTPGASDPTNAAWAAHLDALVDALELRPRVVSTGFLPPARASAALLAADAVALPFRDGATFARGSLLAALAHGVPVVTTTPPRPVRRSPFAGAGGNWPALADGANALLVPPGDPIALAGALRRLAGDAALRSRLGTAGRQVATTFGWPAIAARTRALYRALRPVTP